MDSQKLRELLDEKDEIEIDIAKLVNADKKERAPQKCKICGSLEHTKRKCPNKTTFPAAD